MKNIIHKIEPVMLSEGFRNEATCILSPTGSQSRTCFGRGGGRHFSPFGGGWGRNFLLLLSLVVTNLAIAQNIQLTPQVQPTQGGHTQVGNFGLSYTIGEPVQTTLQNSNLMFTQGFEQLEKPLPPVAPASQTVCSDTAVTFVFSGKITGAGADRLEWSLDSAFTYSTLVNSDSNVLITVNIGSRDTIWMRSRISGSGVVSKAKVFTVLTVNFKPDAPTPPAPQSVASDTAYHFVFTNVNAGFGANQMEWALDSNFTSSTVDTPFCTITLTILPDSFQLIWLRSMDTLSGCVSNTSSTIIMVGNPMLLDTILDTVMAVCVGTSTFVYVQNSTVGVKYNLRIDTTTVNYAYGNDSLISLNTGNIDTSTVFNLQAVDTASGIITFTNTLVVLAFSTVDTPSFFNSDTLVYLGDTIYCKATADNSIPLKYNILSGGAAIDSSSGCVTNITSNFIVRAIARGMAGCDTAIADLHFTVTNIATPIAPSPRYIVVDIPTTLTVSFDTILASGGADQIEWATNPNFEESEILSSPSQIHVTLNGIERVSVWLRNRDSKTGKVSKSAKTEAEEMYNLLSSTLLDKTNWSLQFDDEFNYTSFGAFDPNVTGEWAMNFCHGNDPSNPSDLDNCSPLRCGNHSIYHIQREPSIYNLGTAFGGGSNGGAGELVFSNDGIARFQATQIKLNNVPVTLGPLSCDGYDKSFHYQTAMLTSRRTFNLQTPGLFEIRCKLPVGEGNWPAFWLAGSSAPDWNITEIDIMERNLEKDEDYKLGSSHIHDYTRTSIFNYKPVTTTTGSGSFGTNTVIVTNTADIDTDMYVRGVGIHWNARVTGISGDTIILSDTNLGTVSGNIDFVKPDRVSCGRWFYKQTPCNFEDEWHTYSCVVADSEIVFFVDGKETWSEPRNQQSPLSLYPLLSSGVRMMINLAIAFKEDTDAYGNKIYIPYNDQRDDYEMQVDYVRYYQPSSAWYTQYPKYLQNYFFGTHLTYETPNSSGINTNNNKLCKVSNTANHQTHDVSSTKITTLGTGNEMSVYYQGAGNDHRCYIATSQPNNEWIETPVVAQKMIATYSNSVYPPGMQIFSGWSYVAIAPDVKDFVTPVSSDLIYYQSIYNRLKFYSRPYYFGSPMPLTVNDACVNNNPGSPIRNCAGYITVDNHGKVFYKGTDNNLWCWMPDNGSLSGITNGSSQGSVNNNGMITGAVAVNTCGCMAFYRDAQNNLRQLYWWNGWHDVGVVVSNGKVTDNIILDETNSRVYFIGSDHAIYYYSWNFNSNNPTGLVKLGNGGVNNPANNESTCNQYIYNGNSYYYNALSDLTLSFDKKTLFYKATDGSIWYYFNDSENSIDPNSVLIPKPSISKPNWNKTPLKYEVPIQGSMALEGWNFGRLLYVGSDKKLYQVSPVNGHNHVDCAGNFSDDGYHGEAINTYKTDESDNSEVKKASNTLDDIQEGDLKISVFPNPSNNNFCFTATCREVLTQFEIYITDVNGRKVYGRKEKLADGTNTYTFTWNAESVNGGLYFYRIKTSGKVITGKLVRL